MTVDDSKGKKKKGPEFEVPPLDALDNAKLPPSGVTLEAITQLPKTDLHCHLDGSLRLQTLWDLAAERKVELPARSPEELGKIVIIGPKCEDLEDYLEAFKTTLKVMQDVEGLQRTAFELAEDAARENVRYLEVRYSPILHVAQGLSLTQIVDAVLSGLRLAEKRYKIRTGVILCGIRNIKPEYSLRLAELAVAYKNRGVVGFDLAGIEENYPAKDHQKAFQLILDNNINCTIHAGEAYGAESIAQALHRCGAHRIGHGTRLKEDGDLLNYVNDHRVPLEVCPTSNVQTRSVESLAAHPAALYYHYGLRVTINTDNRLMSNTTVSRELYLAAAHLNLTMDDIKNIIIHGFKSAFLPHRDKCDLLEEILPELGRSPVYKFR